jgi:hypothetical protein
MPDVERERSGSQGPATDRFNAPVIDPTQNVLDLVKAAIQRQDDLRTADGKLRDAQVEHVEAIAELRAQHARELRLIETERINAIREVDTQNVSRAAEVAAQQADALRGQVEAARIAVADTLSTALKPIQDDIASLRQTQYEQAGQKAAGLDPQVVAIQALQTWQATQGGAATQTVAGQASNRWIIVTAISIVALFLTVAYLIISSSHGVTPTVNVVLPTPTP